ncbi:nucleotidyltransferase domain-containing protein [Ornithinimicrobium ciconiae]|uniref:Nucleotidyltransferase domain-containing protein n=1 Tax=Ornithinimicrobium ciconiae TaxID=2594265 RepID=A0A516G700_9MICO|nr:nucleotidyltransferase domain-containing protein [Ornithinimicrobium ciconiae]QDO87298.1 nucleotidyltransferase domain-containing protein [Ornithinimicrobium ciconiae]
MAEDRLIARARAFLRQEFPGAEAAFLGGSAATGAATPGSDLDVLVVLPEHWSPVAFVETSRFDGQLVEAFVYGPASLRVWLEKGRAAHRPVLDRLVAEGIPLTDNGLTHELAAQSVAVLAAGPSAPDSEEVHRRLYSLSSAVDDLADRGSQAARAAPRPSAPLDPAETAVLAWTVWREAAELALVADRQWLGTGKWLVRELRRHGDRYGLLSWADASLAAAAAPDTDVLVQQAQAVLDAAGGYLQEGHLRGHRPPDL